MVRVREEGCRRWPLFGAVEPPPIGTTGRTTLSLPQARRGPPETARGG